MNFLKAGFCQRLLASIGAAVLLSTASVGNAMTVLTFDGRDETNLSGDGNQGTFHNPPVGFAFTFSGVAADNPTSGPGDPYTASDTDFNFTGTDFGGLGFGVSPQLVFSAAQAFAEIDLTVNPANTLPSLTLNLKDIDAPIFAAEELQYTMTLGAAGTKTISVSLASPGFINSPKNGIPDFISPAEGLSELQLQYPFGLGTGAHPEAGYVPPILDVTIHQIRIVTVPEPSSVALSGLGATALCAIGCFRRRQSRSAIA
jgi:hypothetical protein